LRATAVIPAELPTDGESLDGPAQPGPCVTERRAERVDVEATGMDLDHDAL
jgi:hypothetical protein